MLCLMNNQPPLPKPPPHPLSYYSPRQDLTPTQAQLEEDMVDFWEANLPRCERTVVYPGFHRSGFGSQLIVALLNQGSAVRSRRAAIWHPGFLTDYRCRADAPDDQTWASCFKTAVVGPPSCRRELVDGLLQDTDRLAEWHWWDEGGE